MLRLVPMTVLLALGLLAASGCHAGPLLSLWPRLPGPGRQSYAGAQRVRGHDTATVAGRNGRRVAKWPRVDTVARDLGSADDHLQRGILRESNGAEEMAMEDYNAALQRDQSSAEARFRRGRLLLRHEQQVRGREEIELAAAALKAALAGELTASERSAAEARLAECAWLLRED